MLGEKNDKNDNVTNLFNACRKGNLNLVKYLVDLGSNINKVNSSNGWTPLFFACEKGHQDIVKYLMEQK